MNPRLLLVLLLLSGHALGNSRGLDQFDFVRWETQPSGLSYPELEVDQDWVAQLEERNVVTRRFVSATHLGEREITEQVTRVAAYISDEGVRESGNSTVSVDAFAQRLVFTAAEVHLPDGRVVEVDPDTVQVVTDTDDDIFTDEYDLVVPWPALTGNAVTLLRYSLITDRSRLALPWSDLFFAQTLRPIQDMSISLSWEPGATEPGMRTDAAFLACDEDRPQHIVCRASRVDSFPEDVNVNYFDRLPMLAFTELADWEALRASMEAHLEDAIGADDRELDAFAATLYEPGDSPRLKLEKIHRFVARDVRYVGMEHGKSGIIPRQPSVTLEKRYGDCKDKTVLFVDLARRAGIEVHAVLTSTDRTTLGNVLAPSSHYFDHMVACGELYGEPFCVDLTDPYSDVHFTPSGLQGALALRLDRQARKPELLPRDDYRWRMKVLSVNHLRPDGSLTERLTREFQTVYGAQLRSYYAGMSTDDRIEDVRSDFGEVYRTADSATFALKGVDDLGKTVVIVVENEYSDYYIEGAFEVREPASWLRQFVDYFEAENEIYPYELTGFRFESTVEFNLMGRFEDLQPGARLELTNDFGSLTRDYDYDPGKDRVTVTTVLEVPAQDIQPERIEDYNEFLSTLKRHSLIRFSAYPE